jgi:hypothetical protein
MTNVILLNPMIPLITVAKFQGLLEALWVTLAKNRMAGPFLVGARSENAVKKLLLALTDSLWLPLPARPTIPEKW